MRIAIISDTHIHKHPDKIIDFLNNYIRDVDMLIHVGDYTNIKVVDLLKKYPNFMGVWGNNDGDSIRAVLKEKEILRIAGYKIGVFHGHGDDKNTLDRAYDKFSEDNVDIIIFGHSHQPVIMTKGKTLMLNPGSPTYRRRVRWNSYIILELNERTINAELKFFSRE